MSEGEHPDATALRRTMVEALLQAGSIRSRRVEEAFRAVPRHLFLPESSLKMAYADQAIPTKYLDGLAVSAASQPTIVAIMLEGLDLAEGQRVLEIGAGTGYNAALMAHIVGPAGRVVTIDIDEDIVADARAHLRAAGFSRVHVVRGDGAQGYAAEAPYDRIILTVGAADIARAWRDQLAPDGRLLLPLTIGGGVQKVVALEHAGDHLRSALMGECRFMPLRGSAGDQGREHWLDGNPALIFRHDAASPVRPERIHDLLTGAAGDERPHRAWQDYPGVLRITPDELIMGVLPWLDLHQPGFCTVRATGQTALRGDVPPLFSGGSGDLAWRETSGLCDAMGLCLLVCPPPRVLGPDSRYGPPFELALRSFGGDGPLRRVLAALERWNEAGRPSTERMRLRVYPRDVAYTPGGRETVAPRPSSLLVLGWL